ncbi:MAG: EboA domain-containing protein, partial [Lentisphaeraceae bacterium]|nr:EboA domain-containing protein [Lentisphaeraceae bacterium]
MSLSENRTTLELLLRRNSAQSPRNSSFWQAFDKLQHISLDEFMILSAAAPRRLGRNSCQTSTEENKTFSNFPVKLHEIGCGFAARILLGACIENPDYLKEMISRGNDEEQAAAILALNLRHDREDYKELVVHACRTNSSTGFSAISQNNPYPAKFFSNHEFKQLTMKTIFMGLEFTDIHGLEERFHGELGTSLTDFF